MRFKRIFSFLCQPTQKARVPRSGMKVSVTSWEEKGEVVIVFVTVLFSSFSLNEEERIQWGNIVAVE